MGVLFVPVIAERVFALQFDPKVGVIFLYNCVTIRLSYFKDSVVEQGFIFFIIKQGETVLYRVIEDIV